MREVLLGLEKKYIDFICKECNITKHQLFAMSEDEVYDVVYETMCDIECKETPSDNAPLSARCELASELVTELGNTLPEDDEG